MEVPSRLLLRLCQKYWQRVKRRDGGPVFETQCSSMATKSARTCVHPQLQYECLSMRQNYTNIFRALYERVGLHQLNVPSSFLCRDFCLGSVAGVQTTATSSERLTDGAVSSEEKTSSTRVVLAACAVFVMLFTTTIAIVLLRRLKRRGIDPEMVTMMHPEHTNGEATSSQFSPSPVGKLPYAEYTNS